MDSLAGRFSGLLSSVFDEVFSLRTSSWLSLAWEVPRWPSPAEPLVAGGGTWLLPGSGQHSSKRLLKRSSSEKELTESLKT